MKQHYTLLLGPFKHLAYLTHAHRHAFLAKKYFPSLFKRVPQDFTCPYSSVVEHSTADGEVPGSNPVVSIFFSFYNVWYNFFSVQDGYGIIEVRKQDVKRSVWYSIKGKKLADTNMNRDRVSIG